MWDIQPYIILSKRVVISVHLMFSAVNSPCTFLLMLISWWLANPSYILLCLGLEKWESYYISNSLIESSLLHYTKQIFNNHWHPLRNLHWLPENLMRISQDFRKTIPYCKPSLFLQKLRIWEKIETDAVSGARLTRQIIWKYSSK